MLNTVWVLFLNGVFFGAGPCLISCGPLILGYIIGTRKNSRQSLKVWVLFSLARISVYIALGLLTYLLSQLVIQHLYSSRFLDFFSLAAGLFIFFLGLTVFFDKGRNHKFCEFFKQNFTQGYNRGPIILGILLGILPCSPLLGVLFFIALISKNYFQSSLYAFSFGLGSLFSPLLILAIFAGVLPKWLKDRQKIYLIFQRICGILLCYLGSVLITSIFR